MLSSALLVALVGCGADDEIDETILLTVENRSGAELWYFQYSGCGEDSWTEVIAADEYVPDGADVSSQELDPGCYDLYVEDEFGCWSENSTGGNVAGGEEFIWTVTDPDFTCSQPRDEADGQHEAVRAALTTVPARADSADDGLSLASGGEPRALERDGFRHRR